MKSKSGRKWIYAAAILTLIFGGISQAGADTLHFVATGPAVPGLSPLNENPPHPESSATGTGLVTWDTVTNQMTVAVVFSGLTTPNTNAHIHCCVDPPGTAGVATTVPTFTGFPTGTTSGTYFHEFDMSSLTSFNPAFVAAHGGTAASAAADLFAGLQAGRAYLNIHTSMFLGGEMRGFLLSTTPGCPLGQGYWKNHPDDFPVTALLIGCQTYTQAELLAILETPVKGDATLILARQLIAAKLNIFNGSDPTPIAGAISQADALLCTFSGKLPYGVKPSSADGQAMTALASTLDDYNDSLLTPACGQ
jgi:hypothetical protein